jgi:hypothetical protein
MCAAKRVTSDSTPSGDAAIHSSKVGARHAQLHLNQMPKICMHYGMAVQPVRPCVALQRKNLGMPPFHLRRS